MTDITTIALVDGQPLMREGIAHVLDAQMGFKLVAQGASAEEAIEIAATQRPDILIMDLQVPGDGLNALARIDPEHGATKVVILTLSEESQHVLEALRLGARGYILKGASTGELSRALETVASGGSYVSPELATRLLCERIRSTASETDLCSFDARDRAIRTLVCKGYSNKRIALELRLSEKAIKYSLSKAFQKLNVKSRVELALLLQKDNPGASARS